MGAKLSPPLIASTHETSLMSLKCTKPMDSQRSRSSALSHWTSPDLVDTPDEGALREAMLEILPQENLATRLSTWLSQVEARVSFQGI